MKKYLKFLLVGLLAAFASTSCEEEPVLPAGDPEIRIEKTGETRSSVSFRVDAENAEDFAYIVKEGEVASNVSAAEIFSTGVVADLGEEEYHVEGLKAGCNYAVYAAARNGEGSYSPVSKFGAYTGVCTFQVKVDETKVKHSSCEIEVIPSDEAVTYIVVSYPTKLIQDMKVVTEDDIHDFVLRRLKQTAQENGMTLEDLLSQTLLSGGIIAELSGMAEHADNQIYVYAMTTEGERQSSIVDTKVTTTERQMVDLTFELSAEVISATRARIKVVPSDNNLPYCALGMPKSTYPDAETAWDYAEAIVEQWGAWLDAGIMIEKGVLETDKFEIIPGEVYVQVAFGYDHGINSEPQMMEFKAGEPGNPEDATFKLYLEKAYSTNVRFTTDCSDPSIYYMVHMIPSADYNDEVVAQAKAEIESQIQYYLEAQQDFNPGYQMSQAVADVCLNGYREGLTVADVVAGTVYTAFIYGVTVEGKAARNTQVFHDFVTPPVYTPSSAAFTTRFYKYFDGNDVEEETDCFPENDLTDQVIAVVENSVTDDVVKAYYTIYEGDPFAGQGDDYVTDAAQWMEFDGESGIVTPYGFYLLRAYNTDYTVYSVGKNAQGEFGPVGRTHLNATGYEAVSPASELEELMATLQQNAVRIMCGKDHKDFRMSVFPSVSRILTPASGR